jgi:hypothetical protein
LVSWGGASEPMSIMGLNSTVSRKSVSLDGILEGCSVDGLVECFEWWVMRKTVDGR